MSWVEKDGVPGVGGGVELGRGVSYCKGERRDTPTAISVLIASNGRRD